MEKKNLIKLAVTAFAMASVLPAASNAAEDKGLDVGTLLAAGCGGGCGAKKSISYNDAPPSHSCGGQRSNPYSSPYRSYNTAGDASSNPSTGAEWNTNRGYNVSPSYSDSYRSYSTDNSAANDWSSTNRNYNTAGDYDYQRTGTGMSNTASSTLNDADILNKLGPEGKRIYQSLGPEGKALARQLISQDSFKDKDQAVREALKRMNERQGQGAGSFGAERSSSFYMDRSYGG